MKGTIKKIIRERGFGFISAENGKEIFFHSSSLGGVSIDNLQEGTTVEFTTEEGPKGPKAADVKVV
ncbi:MAG: cold shock domain-containing protein [Candidatus Omnitrophica bacterium]|nr:cold shock domain-containing protein [Candidatus Omnitrophota bacterium]